MLYHEQWMTFISKTAKSAFAPFSIEDENEYNSPEGYAREEANRSVGRAAGRIGGALVGGGLGVAVGRKMGRPRTIAQIIKAKPGVATMIGALQKKVNIAPIVAGLLGATGGAVIGNVAGDYKSIRDSEEMAGLTQSNLEDYLIKRLQGKNLGTKEDMAQYLITRGLKEK